MDWIEKYLDYTKESESPTSYHFATALMVLAGAVERKVWFQQGIKPMYPNLYQILVGPPAVRKSTAVSFGEAMLEEIEGVTIASDSITKEAMYVEMEREAVKTFEHGGNILTQTAYTVISSEWGMFMPEKDMGFVLALIELYDCRNHFKRATKTQGKNFLENVWFNMIGCIQPKKLAEILPKSAIGSGFTSRIIFVVEEKPRHMNFNPKFDPEVFEELVEDLKRIHTVIGPFTWTPEAAEWYEAWYLGQSQSSALARDERFAHYIHRKPQHLLKVAMLMRISRDYSKLVLEKQDLQRALGWLDSLEVRMPLAFGSFGMSKFAEATELVRSFVKERGLTTSKELLRIYFRDLSMGELTEIIGTLTASGLIKSRQIAGGAYELTWTGGK